MNHEAIILKFKVWILWTTYASYWLFKLVGCGPNTKRFTIKFKGVTHIIFYWG
jgi:hypothetical protein